MTSFRNLLKNLNTKTTNWESFDWNEFDRCFKTHQENGGSDLTREEVIKLNVIQGLQSIYDLRDLRERRRNLREYERGLRKHKRNLGAPKSSYNSSDDSFESSDDSSESLYDSPKSSYGPLRKPAFRMPKLEKVEPQSRSGRTYYYSAVFRNAAVLRLLVKKFTRYLREHRRDVGET